MRHERGGLAAARFLGQRVRSSLRLIWVLRRLSYPRDLDQMIHLLVDRPFGEAQAFFALQRSSEIRALLARLHPLRPQVVVEIGTAGGGTLYLLTRIAADDARIVSIDLPQGKFGGGYGAWRAPFYRSFARRAQRVELLRLDSHTPAARQRLASRLRGSPIDVLFIDGDHHYEGVARDFRDYSPLVRSGGCVVLHDICPDPGQPDNQVPRLWGEMRSAYRTEELVEGAGSGYGIGVLWL